MLASITALSILSACQAAGKNPDNVEIPIIQPTADTSLCHNKTYPQEAPEFEDVSADQLVGDADGIKIYDRVTGSGTAPKIEDLVTVNYTGWLDNGCIFDSSYSRGTTSDLILVSVIQGWREAMLTMSPGTIRRVEVPAPLAYREIGSPPMIPPNATLTYEIELISVLTPAEAIATATVVAANTIANPVPTATPEGGYVVSDCDNSDYPETAPQFEDVTEDQYATESSGIRVFDIKVGNGKNPDQNNRVDVHYTGWLASDGCVFDSSYTRGESISFPVGGVIPGFRDAILGMKVGGQRRVYIPSDQGYGAQGAGGAIPPNADLVFDIVLEDVR